MKLLRSIILYNLYKSGLFTDIMRSIMESGSVVMTVTVYDNDSGGNFWHYSYGVFDDCPYGR